MPDPLPVCVSVACIVLVKLQNAVQRGGSECMAARRQPHQGVGRHVSVVQIAEVVEGDEVNTLQELHTSSRESVTAGSDQPCTTWMKLT